MTIKPTETGYILFMSYKGRKFVTECDTPELCWSAAVEWMGGV